MAKGGNIYPKMDRNERDIYKANMYLEELERQGMLDKSPAAVVYLRKYGNELGVKSPTRFSYSWATKAAQKIAGQYARDFLASATSTPTGIATVNEHRRQGMLKSNFLNLSTASVDRFLVLMDRVGDIINNYSLGSDVVATVAEIANMETENSDLIELVRKYSETDGNLQAALDLFEEDVQTRLDRGEKLTASEMEEILLDWLTNV